MPERSTTSTLNVPIDKLLEDAEETGHLHLAGRKISIFPPTASSFDLSDVIEMDLSENRFVELPELTGCMVSLEKIICYNNVLRTVPELLDLSSLVHLDLSRNHISELPQHIWRLPLRTLNISHNRLMALPEEMSDLASLMDLDASGNEIATLPESIGHLINLRDLNIRRNHLSELPESLTSLKLVRLDFSVNRVCHLPLAMIKMTSLMTLILHDNPLIMPPTSICIRGRVHIFKYLKEELDRVNGKDDGNRRGGKRADSRVNRNARISKGGSVHQRAHLAPRASRTLEEEVADVASKHGLNWSGVQASTPVSSSTPMSSVPTTPTTPLVTAPEKPKQPANISHNYAVLEPLPLDNHDGNAEADDATPQSSPTLERPAPKPVVPVPEPAAEKTPPAPVKSKASPRTTKSTKPSTTHPSTKVTNTSAGRLSSRPLSTAGAKSGTPKSSHATSRTSPATARASASPGTKRNTSGTAAKPTGTAGSKASPQIARAATSGKSASPKVSKATSSTTSTTSSTRPATSSASSTGTTTTSTRPAGKKPPAAAKPSAQEISAKMTTKKRLEMEWMERQKEEEIRAKRRQQDLVERRKLQEKEQADRNRKRASVSEPLERQAPPKVARHSVDMEKLERDRAERHEMISAAEASRQKWQKQEKSDSTSTSPRSMSQSEPTSKRNSVGSLTNEVDGILEEGSVSESSSPRTTRTLPARGSRPPSTSSLGSTGSDSLEKPASVRKDRHQYTVRRAERDVKRGFDTLENIRKLVESVMKASLPEDLADGLSDGVILCNLVNQLKPNTIGIVYTPPHRARSGADPAKLSMLKSVKNVDAFISGCRKLGLDSGLVCSPADILEMKDPLHVYITVRALVNQYSDTQEVFNV